MTCVDEDCVSIAKLIRLEKYIYYTNVLVLFQKKRSVATHCLCQSDSFVRSSGSGFFSLLHISQPSIQV